MVWTYVKDVYRFIPYSNWMTFGETFPYIWAASASKGRITHRKNGSISVHDVLKDALLKAIA